jgi:AcrR family transcriptional regulator
MAARPRPAPEPELLRPPQQTRSRESLERVLVAGQQLLEEKGWEGFTVQEVSRRAKVSIGSIYARAPSKEALILAVYDRAVEEIARENAEALTEDGAWEAMGTRELIVEAVREMGRQMLNHELILRRIMNRAPVDAVIRARGDAQIRRLGERWEELLRRRESEYRHPEPDLAIEVAFRMVFATVARRVALGAQFGAPHEVSDQRLLDEVGRAVAAYLLER